MLVSTRRRKNISWGVENALRSPAHTAHSRNEKYVCLKRNMTNKCIRSRLAGISCHCHAHTYHNAWHIDLTRAKQRELQRRYAICTSVEMLPETKPTCSERCAYMHACMIRAHEQHGLVTNILGFRYRKAKDMPQRVCEAGVEKREQAFSYL